MGASTVAGAISTFPIFRDAGNTRADVGRAGVGTGDSPVLGAAASALSQNLLTPLFYVLSNTLRVCDNPACSQPMNRIREILLTEYIGAILVALLVSDAIIALITLVVGQIYWHAAFAGRYHESLGHSILTTLVKMLLYLASAYILVRWLYGVRPPVAREGTESPQASREV